MLCYKDQSIAVDKGDPRSTSTPRTIIKSVPLKPGTKTILSVPDLLRKEAASQVERGLDMRKPAEQVCSLSNP